MVCHAEYRRVGHPRESRPSLRSVNLKLTDYAALSQIPTAGSFPHWATRFIDPAVGFSLGPLISVVLPSGDSSLTSKAPIPAALSYGYCYTIAIASEVSAASVIVSYWTDISPALVISIGLALILFINLMPIRLCVHTGSLHLCSNPALTSLPHSYGEAEVVSAIVKITCFLGLIFTSLVITLGGAPNHERIGFRYWNNPGPWTNFNGE